jgi:uncharacterized membrane protein YphA (DoxX/SURF4 family)
VRVPVGVVWLGRLAVAAVWVYEGLVAKIIGSRADEQAILASVPVLGAYAGLLAVLIGAWELLLAILVLIGRLPRLVALAQTLTLVAFNAGGLLVGRAQIADPAHLLVTNAAFLVLAWTVAAALHSRRLLGKVVGNDPGHAVQDTKSDHFRGAR